MVFVSSQGSGKGSERALICRPLPSHDIDEPMILKCLHDSKVQLAILQIVFAQVRVSLVKERHQFRGVAIKARVTR